MHYVQPLAEEKIKKEDLQWLSSPGGREGIPRKIADETSEK